MVQEYHIGDEPIPGYRLTKFLGRGGFGEVWQAVAPGRTEVALKIISLDRKQGMKEFRSLRLVKRIRHPNLTPILAFWLKDSSGNVLDDDSIDLLDSGLGEASARSASVLFNAARADQLVIAMGLGDMNLLALLQDYQAAGQTGIPAEELLDYMEGCARAIDYLNTARHDLGAGAVAIQHCDIKPQNIMIVGDAVQVCDFGLARSLTDVRSTSVAGSIAYGAPELFWENKPSGATDQYSLAISYYELRTGCLPFGLEMAQLEVMQAHRDGTLDFSRVDDCERAVLVRATAPSPEARFERTIDMVRALRRAVQSASQVAAAAAPPAGSSGLAGSAILESGREILPGYKLLEHLFHADAATDVWSATAPGAKPQSLWIYDLSRAEGRPDLASLRMAQRFANPRLARIAEIWLVDEAGDPQLLGPHVDQAALASCRRLIAVSELTRTNLAHRLEECRESMGTGIPQPELLAYLRMAAEGVDALNAAWHPLDASRKASLMHRELRPENLLLFHHDVKIGNLAWVRALESDAMQLPESARRPARMFSAPELDRDRLTRWSDQYSLAVCYALMRTGDATGHAPSGMVQAGMVQPGRQALDLAALPPAEAEVLAKALHSRPEQRFADCRQMVAALEQASRAAPLAASAAPVEAKPAAPWSGTIMAPAAEAAQTASSAEVQLIEAPESASLADTNPETEARRSTIVEPSPTTPAGPAAPLVRRRRLTRSLAAAALAGAMAAAFMIGDDAQHVAEQLAGERQYKQAIESLDDASWWRSWRVDRGGMRRTIVGKAVATAKDAAGAGETAKACSIFAELAAMPDVLLKADIDDFRQNILPLAIQHAQSELAAGKYQRAGEVQRQLAGVFADNSEVVGLGQAIVDRASAAAIEHARLDDFEPAIDIYLELKAFAPDADPVKALRARLIDLGREAVERRQKREDMAAALAIYRPLEKAFDGDHGVRKAGLRLIDEALGAIRSRLDAGQIVEAKVIYRELSQLRPDDSDVVKLGESLLAAELAPAEKLLADDKWTGALAIYERTASNWPPQDSRLEDLKKRIIEAALAEIDALSIGMGPEQASEAAKPLSAAFPEDPRIKALVDKLEKMGGSSDAPERVAVQLLDRIDSDLELGSPDDLSRPLDQAERELKDLPGRDKLRQRLTLSRAHFAVLRTNWDEASRLLAELGPGPFPDKEAGQRTRLNILKALALARFDGGALDASANLLEIGQAAAAVAQDDAAWNKGPRFRADASRFGKLIDRLIARCVESAFSDDRAARQLAGQVLATLEHALANAPNGAVQAQTGAAKTHLLLVGDPAPDRDAVVASLASWRDRAGEIGAERLEALAAELSRWGVKSAEPQALEAAIAALGGLRGYGDAPKARYAELLVEQLARAAASPAPAWPELLEKCRVADEASTVAGGAARQSFVKACWAECLWEGSPERDVAGAKTRLKEALSSKSPEIAASDQSYLDYVAALIDASGGARQLDGPMEVGATLSLLFEKPSGLLDAPFRRARAFKLLVQAAARRMQMDGAAAGDELGPVPADAADAAADWLEVAKALLPGDSTDQRPDEPLTKDLTLLQAAAACYKTSPDWDSAAALSGKAIDDGPPSARAYLINARALSRQAQAERALRSYADALGAVKIKPNSDRLKSAYEQIVKPALELVEAVKAPDLPTGRAIARLCATKGKLLLFDGEISAMAEQESGQSMQAEIFDAYQKAVRYDPTVADYYVERGMARSELPDCDLDKLKTEDLEPAAKLFSGEPTAAYFGLAGSLAVRTGRTKAAAGSIEQRTELYKQAIADYQTAIRRCAPGDDSQSRFLVACSAANLELANYTDEPDDVIRAYLTEAQKLAGDATKIETRPHPEFAWRARGNAEEDFGWLLGDKDRYEDALSAFEQAISESPQGGSSPGKAWLGLGRTRMRLALSGAQSGAARETSLRRALEDLEAATRSSRLSDGERAEAYYWQRDIHAALGQQAEADRAAELALKNAPSPQARALYQYAWAASAPDARQKQERARSILADNPVLVHSMLGAQLVQLIAAGHLPTAPNATDQQVLQALDQGLKEYVRYFPAVSETAKAGLEDAWALIFVSQHLSSSPRFWRTNFEMCKQASERAVQLAEGQPSLALLAHARAARGGYRLLVSHSEASQRLSAAQKAVEDFDKLVELDEGLAAARLTARERRDLEKISWLWRFLYAKAKYEIADDSGTSREQVAALCDEASLALDKVKHLSAVAGLRKQILALKRDRGG